MSANRARYYGNGKRHPDPETLTSHGTARAVNRRGNAERRPKLTGCGKASMHYALHVAMRRTSCVYLILLVTGSI
jgi:hypothetical protein